MNTRLTVADASLFLEQYSGPNFMPRLNLVLARYTSSGLWNGVCNESFYGSGTGGLGYITLSRYDESILGVDFCCRPQLVYNQFYQFNPIGIGYVPEDKKGCGSLYDMGDGFVTQRDITGTCTLRLKLEDPADAGKTVRFYGKDEDGKEIYTSAGIKGSTLTTVSPSADTTQLFTSLSGIQFPFFQGYVTLWQVILGVETQIGVYAPGETRPCYRRYKTGIIDDNVPIRLFCRQRFLPVVAPTDWVIPGNLGALKFGLLAIIHEDAGRLEEGRASWLEGERLLNEELSAIRGSAITTLRVMGNDTLQGGWGWGGGFSNGYGYGNWVN